MDNINDSQVEKQESLLTHYYEKSKYKYFIIAPNGNKYETTNLAEFCKKHNLHISSMKRICSGKQSRYKNWTGYREKSNKN